MTIFRHGADCAETHVSLIINRTNFWYIEEPTPRAFFKQVLRPVQLSGKNLTLLLPSNVGLFRWEIEHNRFLKCNAQLKTAVEDSFPVSQKSVIDAKEVESLVRVRDAFLSLPAPILLAAGTLLGWYRHCGFIPHTTDIDFMLSAEVYKSLSEENFYRTIMKTGFKPFQVLGRVRKSVWYSNQYIIYDIQGSLCVRLHVLHGYGIKIYRTTIC